MPVTTPGSVRVSCCLRSHGWIVRSPPWLAFAFNPCVSNHGLPGSPVAKHLLCCAGDMGLSHAQGTSGPHVLQWADAEPVSHDGGDLGPPKVNIKKPYNLEKPVLSRQQENAFPEL